MSFTATYGFESHVDQNGLLNIVQNNADGSTDQVILSPAEAAALFKRYATFAKRD
jgi:hypothetical protein